MSVRAVPATIEQRLDNGLRVVVAEDSAVPAVAVSLSYGVGSRHETPGRTGLAHLFEHLMFQGSANVASGEHFAVLEALGAQLNASTSFDRTYYYETVPANGFELALWLEGDRMGGLLAALTQENLDNQRDVVKNERRQRYDNQPYGTARERLFAALFPPGHPYHHLPIGSMADLDDASLDDVRTFFRTHYAPDNAVLAVVGDVTAGTAFAAARRYFGEIPAQPLATSPADVSLAPLSRQVGAEDFSEVPAEALYAIWRMPSDGSAACDAAQVAFQVLGGGAGSRLYKRLARRLSLAQSLYADLQRLVGGNSVGLVVIRAHDGASLGEIQTVLDEELELLATEGLGDEELERALAQLESEWLSRTSTYAGRADELSRLTCLLGDPGLAATSVERLRSVSAAQVRAVAEHWLRPHQRVQLTYRHASPAPGTAPATEAAR